jgi:hypothetical protein
MNGLYGSPNASPGCACKVRASACVAFARFLAQGESGRALGRRKQGNFVLFVEGSTRHDRVISNGSSYRLRRRETLIVHFGDRATESSAGIGTLKKCSCLGSGLILGFHVWSVQ